MGATFRDGPGEAGGPVLTSDDIEADKREGMSDDLVDQEYYLSWDAAIPGAYYSHEFREVDLQRRITRCPYDPSYVVYTFWDIGVDDANAIWCVQFIGRQICLIHYYENQGFGAPHYAEYLMKLPWAEHYRAHVLPHDGRVRDWGTGDKREDALQRLIQGQVHVAIRSSLETGIGQVRLMFPRLLFDEVGCERGIEALRSYHHDYDPVRQKFKDEAEHDWASHGADALRTLAGSLELIDQIEKQHEGKVPLQPEQTGWRYGVATGRGSRTGWMG